MASFLTSGFSRVIEDKRYLGFNEANEKIKDRFSFFVAKKRELNGRYYEVKGPGEIKIPARFFYMHDRATNDVYGLHTPQQLPQFFLFAGAGAIPATAVTVVWNVAKMIVMMVHTVFETFQEIYLSRHSEDVTRGFLGRLQNKGSEKFEDVKRCLLWIQSSIGFFIAFEAAVINALLNWDDAQTLFEMKVVVARIENLWNREVSFRDSTCIQLTKFNRDFKTRTEKDPDASKYEVINELLRDINWKNFFSVTYIAQCFQSRGSLDENVKMTKTVNTRDPIGILVISTKIEEVTVPKFDIKDNTLKKSYKEFSDEMDQQDKTGSWRIDL